jgi:hypothetical protein
MESGEISNPMLVEGESDGEWRNKNIFDLLDIGETNSPSTTIGFDISPLSIRFSFY